MLLLVQLLNDITAGHPAKRKERTMIRPHYDDLGYGGDLALYDVVELKLDGMWATCVVVAGVLTVYARSGAVKLVADAPGIPNCTLVGEYLRGTPWSRAAGRSGCLRIHDALEIEGRNLTNRPQSARRYAAGQALRHAPAWISLVEQYPVKHWHRLWAEHVEGGDWEGLVFKSSRGTYGEPWGRMKRTATCDYVCLGFNPGAGRYAGQAASIRGGLYVGTELRQVCSVGGLSDELRHDLAAHPDHYRGRVFEASGKGLFASGALRHPAFGRFRADKQPSQCVLAA